MSNIYVSDKTMEKFERLYWLMPDNNITDDELVNYLVTRELNDQERTVARQVVAGGEHV